MSDYVVKGPTPSTTSGPASERQAGHGTWLKIEGPDLPTDRSETNPPRNPDVVQDRGKAPAGFLSAQDGRVIRDEGGHIGNETDRLHALSSQPPSFGTGVIARLVQILRDQGPQAAAQALHAALRQLPPDAVSDLLDAGSVLIATICDQVSGGRSGQLVSRPVGQPPADARMVLTLAELSAAVERDPRDATATRITQALRGLRQSSASINDDPIFTALCQVIELGAGFKLSLIMVEALAEENEDPDRRRALCLMLATALCRMGARVERRYEDAVRRMEPLLIEWAGWRSEAIDDADVHLCSFLHDRPDFADNVNRQLEGSERAGLEALQAVRHLSALHGNVEFSRVRRLLLESGSVFGAIATSRTALREIREISGMALDGEENGGISLEAVKLVLEHIGFSAPQALFLADLSQARPRTILEAGWTALEDFAEMQAKGRVFQRILAFMNGQYVVEVPPLLIGFDDLEP